MNPVGSPALTGAWRGVYRYAGGYFPETPFTVELVEIDGILTGATEEPNMIWLTADVFVTATIAGERQERTVRFTKHMDGAGGMFHAIEYAGTLSREGTRIEGTWEIEPDLGAGTFFMERGSSNDNDGRTVR